MELCCGFCLDIVFYVLFCHFCCKPLGSSWPFGPNRTSFLHLWVLQIGVRWPFVLWFCLCVCRYFVRLCWILGSFFPLIRMGFPTHLGFSLLSLGSSSEASGASMFTSVFFLWFSVAKSWEICGDWQNTRHTGSYMCFANHDYIPTFVGHLWHFSSVTDAQTTIVGIKSWLANNLWLMCFANHN